MNPYYTIIIPYHQPTVTDEELEKCLQSIKNQQCKDYEVLIYNDGKLKREPSEEIKKLLRELNTEIIETEHEGVWGHNNRNRGLREAKGKYIIHLNADNVLYNRLLELKAIIEQRREEVFVVPIIMNGVDKVGEGINTVLIPVKYPSSVLMLGYPKLNHIDALQLVTTKEVWESIGGWSDYSMNSDGKLYERICKENDWYHVKNIILGEHN
jgi:glycosyltransferase involved in cell wall biosynthesis